ncbi:mitochondrial 18 KDa protein-domain-containing protein [Lineolata rhizophorae]|uniref:Mitochondrial fission process protein 1 n=1 Tax=Lineolata rhizophorae TaxID=578093 RepID=A0A6A6NUU0_9PEZI|nr:mitochondrial 18 KDa protein-domain-containing protein [Lineolata rhizophorae]
MGWFGLGGHGKGGADVGGREGGGGAGNLEDATKRELIERDPADDIPRERPEPRPDFSKQEPAKKLPAALEETLEDEEKMWDALYEGTAPESTESSLRYAAYATRVRTILLSAHRYVAYTSDIGESFRPVAHPWLVRGAYGVSWAYIAGDVAHEGYKAFVRNRRATDPDRALPIGSRGATAATVSPPPPPPAAVGTTATTTATSGDGPKAETRKLGPGATSGGGGAHAQGSAAPAARQVSALEDYRTVMVQRAIFQSLASMGLPAFTIHSIVKYSGKAMRNVRNGALRTWGPIGLGLSIVPALPYIFDEPVEKAVEWTFHNGFEKWGRPAAVSGMPRTGRHEKIVHESREGSAKEKES